jgi:tRNA 2-thiocytidine biosynthesis protein TtcA
MSTKLEKKLLALIREANQNWDLFREGETILVGISGGKDSLSLLKLLSNFDLDLHSLHVRVKPGISGKFLDYCRLFSRVHILETDIYNKAFDPNAGKNACFICMRERRKAVVTYGMEQGFSSIYYGHHKNDVVETFLLNQFYGRELSTMLPKQELFDGLFHILRPLYLIPEPLLSTYAREQEIPVEPEDCPAAINSRRNYLKKQLDQINNDNPKIDVIDNIFSSMKRINLPFIPGFPDTQVMTNIRKPGHKKKKTDNIQI